MQCVKIHIPHPNKVYGDVIWCLDNVYLTVDTVLIFLSAYCQYVTFPNICKMLIWFYLSPVHCSCSLYVCHLMPGQCQSDPLILAVSTEREWSCLILCIVDLNLSHFHRFLPSVVLSRPRRRCRKYADAVNMLLYHWPRVVDLSRSRRSYRVYVILLAPARFLADSCHSKLRY